MKSLTFTTNKPPPPAFLPVNVASLLRDLGARAVCHPIAEGAMMRAGCPILERIGFLFPGEGEKLGRLMWEAYGAMATSPGYLLVGSAVPFCLSSKPKGGHLFLHVPKGADSSTPVLLLLHGYGGNLLYFPWAIQKEMAECVIIAPSWQVDWMDGSFEDRRAYVELALACASKKVGKPLSRPWLVSLSQGGPMAFELATALPEKFTGLLGISSMTGDNPAQKVPRRFPVRLLHGSVDNRVSCEGAQETVRAIQEAGGDARITVIPGADHFLLLSHRKEMGRFLRESI